MLPNQAHFANQVDFHDEPTLEKQTEHTLRNCVKQSLANYFSHLDGYMVTDFYRKVMDEVEAPLFEAVMIYSNGNQTKASVLLGLNRGTLRKKLKQYGLEGVDWTKR